MALDTAIARAIAQSIPNSSSPGWGVFMASLVIVITVTLILSPRLVDSVRRFKYARAPEKDRRSGGDAAPLPPECVMHQQRINALEQQLRAQKEQIEADRLMFLRELQSLRQFIEDKFRQDHEYAQTERLAQEQRITSLITSLINQVSR